MHGADDPHKKYSDSDQTRLLFLSCYAAAVVAAVAAATLLLLATSTW